MVASILLVLAGVLIVGIIWIMLYDSSHFQTSEYTIRDPGIQKTGRAVLIADLHNQQYGRDNALLLDAIRKGKPDFVLLAGDILTAKPDEKLDIALHFIKELAKEYPVYYGVGNHEHRLKLYPDVYGDMMTRYEKGLSEAGVSLMVNQSRYLEEYGIVVTGAEIHQRFYQRFHRTFMEADYLQGLLGKPDAKYYQILLAHNPDYFPEYAAYGADLVLSGHVHGGVVRIPFWNRGIASPAVRLFPKYDGGCFEEGKSRMILSRGLGCHTIPFRLFNPGDLIFLEFRHGETANQVEIKSKKKGKKGKCGSGEGLTNVCHKKLEN